MKAEQIAKIAEECVGKNRRDVESAGTHAWCANFVSFVLKKAGINLWDLSCTSMQKRMKDSKDWSEPDDYPERGDIIFFDWDKIKEEKPLDHVGVVVDYDAEYNMITYINGNGDSSEKVTRQSIACDDSYQIWMRYVSDEDMTEDTFTFSMRVLKKGCKGKDVKRIQHLLIQDGYSCGHWCDDGDFGDATEKAVIAWQKAHRLTADGIFGKETMTEFMKR